MDLISIIIIIFEFAANRDSICLVRNLLLPIFFFRVNRGADLLYLFLYLDTWIYLFHFYPALDLLVSTNFSIELRPMYGDRCVCVCRQTKSPAIRIYVCGMRSSTKEREDRESKKCIEM